MNKIRFYRELVGLTQADLAKAIGCTRGAICHYETGRRGVDIEQCREFISVFRQHGEDLTIDDLFPPQAA
ncbi:transcriptional regulator [Serratia marcescens]|nr:transcriptional regulator [Serratia marcescens]